MLLYCKHDSDNWANLGTYLEDLTIIHLSSIVDESKEVIYPTNAVFFNPKNMFSGGHFIADKPKQDIETVTISKADYDRFLKLENKEKKADQKFLDKCAISAMNGYISSYGKGKDVSRVEEYSNSISCMAYLVADQMLNKRNQRKKQ